MVINEEGFCVCDLEKGFSIDEYGNCVCPTRYGYRIDTSGYCRQSKFFDFTFDFERTLFSKIAETYDDVVLILIF